MIENNDLPRVNISRNYPLILAFVIPMTIIGLFFVWVFTVPIILSISDGLRLTCIEIWSAFVVNVLVLGLVIFAWVVGYTESSIEITETYIRKKGFFRSTTIRWTDMMSIYMIGTRVTIQSQNKKLKVNTVYYREPEKLIKFIDDHRGREKVIINTQES